MKILWILFWGHHKIGLYLGVITMHLGSLLKGKVQSVGYFMGLLKFQTFFWVLEIPDIFFFFFWGGGGGGVNSRCWARACVYRKK